VPGVGSGSGWERKLFHPLPSQVLSLKPIASPNQADFSGRAIGLFLPRGARLRFLSLTPRNRRQAKEQANREEELNERTHDPDGALH